MGVRFVKFGQTYVNPTRVRFVADVYSLGEIDIGASAPIKTGVRTAEVIKMLEDAMAEPPGPANPEGYLSETVRKELLADVVRYLEGKLAPKV
jgi:hypothetical protein